MTQPETEKATCERGHEFTPENTYWKNDGRHRECKQCRKRRYLVRQAKARQIAASRPKPIKQPKLITAPKAPPTANAIRLFWGRAQKSDGCWTWAGAKNRKGYGLLNTQGVLWMAHRLSWVIHNGPIVGDFMVCHKCDNPKCVRPDHLFLGTAADNFHDSCAKGRQPRDPKHARAFVKNFLGPAKLTVEVIPTIRARIAAGEAFAAIGRDYGVKIDAISRIHSRKAWGHVQ